jgi:hypothetical protein
MKEQTQVKQQAQGQATAPLFTRLLGQLSPAFIGLPALDENLY